MEPSFLSQKLSSTEGLPLSDPLRVRGDSAKQPSAAVTARAYHPPHCPATDEVHSDSQHNVDGHISDSRSTTVSLTPTLSKEQHGKGFWKVFLDIICATYLLFLVFISLLLSLGIPYWYYRSYRLDNPSSVLSSAEEEKIENGLENPIAEKWNKILTRLTCQWKAFFAISAGALPAVFPMLAIYPDPKCSWASLLATLALFSGLTSMCIAKLFLLFVERFREEAMVEDWTTASRSTWIYLSSQRFWLLISLPAMWWSSQISALIVAIILGVWEQVTDDPLEGVCLQSRLQLFRILILVWLLMAVAHFTFFISTIRSLIDRT